MNNKVLLISLSLISLVGISIVSSCTNKKDEDIQKPVIQIEEPGVNDTLSAYADSVHIEFTASDNDEIHEVLVKVTDSAGNIVFSDMQHADNANLTYHKHYKPSPISSIMKLTLAVQASDHNENIATETRQFYLKP